MVRCLFYPVFSGPCFLKVLNFFYRLRSTYRKGIKVGGGRHTTVEYNSFSGCDFAVSLDDRGLNWQSTLCPPGELLLLILDAAIFLLVFS